MELSLEARNVTKKYSGFTLQDVSFSLPKGSIMGFIGENGAGKTTTVKLILNLIRRDSGIILINGLDNRSDEKAVKQQLGVVLDESNFHESMKPGDVSKIMANIFDNWNCAEFDRLLGQFELPKNKTVKEYSKGMKMKLSIAAALAHDPKLLILDEPTGGLDPVARSEILDIFLDFIQREDRSILFSSHITNDLEKVADYITFLHQGRVVLSDSKDNLIDRYGLLRCAAADFSSIDEKDIAGFRKNQFGCDALVLDKAAARQKYAGLVVDDVSLEDIMLFYVRGTKQ